MTNLEFKNAELTSMSNDELKETDGGIFGWDDVAVAVVAYVIIETIDGVARYANGERKR